MIYPNTFEDKIGFSEIRTLLKGRCLSSLGTEKVQQMTFMTNAEEINKRLLEVQEFRQILETEDFPNENFIDVRSSLMRIRPQGTYLDEMELFDLKRSLETIINISHFFSSTEAEDETVQYPALSSLCEGLNTYPLIVREINEILNKYGKIKDNASPLLSQIRNDIDSTTRSISRNLREILTSAQNEGLVEKDTRPTLRDGRLVIPIAPALKKKIKGIVHDESATGKTVFIEPAIVIEANNRIRELKGAEKREIIRILTAVSEKVRPYIKEMISSYQILGWIDFIRAKAIWADKTKGQNVSVNENPLIDWIQAIHPLLQNSLEKYGKKMIPLDIQLDSTRRILIISGPNAGGKSVCLKTTGLLQYMVQCGIPIPLRENSKVGTFDGIFIDIGDEQSLDNDLSTYSSHLQNMKIMMKQAGKNSLLLIDEFGGGTEPQIGGAIAEAILNRFVQNQTFGVITTHYQNLKYYADKHSGVINGAMLYDRQQMKPLFQLQIGQPGSSFAIEIARKIGIPQDVINEASEIVGKEYIQSDKYLQDIVRDKRYWETKRQNIHLREKHLEQIIAHYEEEISGLKKEQKEVLQKAKQEAESLLAASNAKIENTIKNIKESNAEREQTRQARQNLEQFKLELEKKMKQTEEDGIARKIEQLKKRRERKDEKKQQNKKQQTENVIEKAGQQKILPISVGDYVKIKGQTTSGWVKKIDRQQATVVYGGNMLAIVKVDRLEAADAPKQKTITSSYVGTETQETIYAKKMAFKPEIDVRGMRGEEAINQIVGFIDDAALLGISPVRILHGTGNGILRNLIREYLKTQQCVLSFQDEHVQFGGAGITVVTIG